ncbi:MAG: hypothetical protein RL693_1597 [Verrucomicrobiota bacterium]|jgi:multidrug efflux system outer membrane protein
MPNHRSPSYHKSAPTHKKRFTFLLEQTAPSSTLSAMTPRIFATVSVSSLLALSSCTVGPDYKEPETKVDATFGNAKKGSYTNDAVIAGWWKKFNDRQLNSLIELALANNHDLRIAAAHVEEAKALRSAARLDFFPTVTSSASYINQKLSRAQSPLQSTSEIYDGGFDASYEIDFWGRVRNNYRAALAQEESAEALRQDTMVLLTAEVARAYLELRGLQNQLSVAQRNSVNQRETLKLTESLLQGGRGTELDTARARAQLSNTLAAIPVIENSISKDMYRISVLVGSQPTALEGQLKTPKPMPTLPSIVRIGNPADLLRRRPDIRSAERLLDATTRRVGVATADLFPRVTFNGSAAIQAETFSGFGGAGIGATSFGPRITWPAFDMGRVKAQIRVSNARVEGQLATYEKTVLTALEETEDALVEFGLLRVRRNHLRDAATASEQAAKLARDRFQNGVADFLTVLDAERVMLEAQNQQAQSETATATSLVGIYKALGGGWESSGVKK